MKPVIRQLPPHVLAPEVAASARDVIDGRELTPVGRMAIEEAWLQLEVERAAIGQSATARFDRVAALAQSGGSSLQLAALALEQGTSAGERRSYEAQVEYATRRLDDVAADLHRLNEGDVEAAKRIDTLFDVIIERVLAPAGIAS